MSELLNHNQSQWKAFLKAQEAVTSADMLPEHYLCELSDWELLFVEGADASTFLQGQISCDMEQCTPGAAVHGACINIKGRVIANFIVITLKAECFVLACPSGNGENLFKQLKKYSVFSKVNLHFDSSDMALLLTDGSSNNDKAHRLQLPNETQVLLFLDSSSSAQEHWLNHANAQQRFSSSLFNLVCIETALVFTQNETSELFTPQEINLDLTGAISFTKGCYTGQEVVARLHYRGVPKRRVYQASLSKPIQETLLAMQVMDEEGKEQGHIVAYDQHGHSGKCLISLNRKCYETFKPGQGSLKLAEHELSVENLKEPPYSLE